LVWVHCEAGYRASLAASFLDAAGRTVVAVDDEYEHAARADCPSTARWHTCRDVTAMLRNLFGKPYRTVSAVDAAVFADGDAILLDVRERHEWQAGPAPVGPGRGHAGPGRPEPYSSLRPTGVTRGCMQEQGRGQPPCLVGREPGPGAGPGARRSADVEADALGRVAVSAEDEMADPDLPAAHGPEADVKIGAAGAGSAAVHSMPPRANVSARAPRRRWPAVARPRRRRA
jgi:rhodanese-related sulfurtransferase